MVDDVENKNTGIAEEYITNSYQNSDNFSDNGIPSDFDTVNNDLAKEFKLYKRFFLQKLHKYLSNLKAKRKTKFTNVLYLTKNCSPYTPDSPDIFSPLDYINNLKKQYPNYNFAILCPVTGISSGNIDGKKLLINVEKDTFNAVKISNDFEIFAENRCCKCSLYKIIKPISNIPVFGIYSEEFSHQENYNKSFLFVKASRFIITNRLLTGFEPNIVHVDRIPFFEGIEFEKKFPSDIKVLQIYDDFIKYEAQKEAPFRALITHADKKTIKKTCRDLYIIKGLSALFNTNSNAILKHYDEYINKIIENYDNFNNTAEENNEKTQIIFKYFDARVRKLYPNFVTKEDMLYYPVISSFRYANTGAVISKTYYEKIFENNNIVPPNIKTYISKLADKIGYIEPVPDTENLSTESVDMVYYGFDSENFRTKRVRNKNTLMREFGDTRVKTGFIDKLLFKNENYKVSGCLDYMFDSPLLYADISDDMFKDGVDILFDTVMKLFEQNKNIKIIISSENGLKTPYSKTRTDFFNNSKLFYGRWLFIEGRVNLSRFMSAADIYLSSGRCNVSDMKALLAMNYGCVPVVTKTGLQNDYVTDIFSNLSTGSGFKADIDITDTEKSLQNYYETVLKALDLYNNNHSGWNYVIKNCMLYDNSWNFNRLENFDKMYSKL